MKLKIINRTKCKKYGPESQGIVIEAESVRSFVRNSQLLKSLEWEPVYSDVLILKGESWLPLKLTFMEFIELFFFSYRYQLSMNNDRVLYPYSVKTRTLSFAYRSDNGYTTKARKKLLTAAIAGILLNLFFPFKRPVLIFEKMSNRAQDNGFNFFEYAIKQSSSVYFLIREGSPDYKKVVNMPNIVKFGSWKHFFLLYRSKLFVSSETGGHAFFWRQNMGITPHVVRTKPLVFLQHGILGFKKLDDMLRFDKLGAPIRFNVSSNFEKKIVIDNLGYDEQHVSITGLSRWDRLDVSQNKKHFILIFYTWRPWLDDIDKNDFAETEYYKNVESSSKIITKVSKKLGKQAIVVAHPKMQEYFTSESHFKVLTDTDESLDAVLDDTALLITDYSSLSWEAYYREIPVIFNQFDLNKYESAVGGYIDLRHPPFGETVVGANIKELIFKSADRNFILTDHDLEAKEKFFQYHDLSNSKRVWEEIQNINLRLEKKRKLKQIFTRLKKILKNNN